MIRSGDAGRKKYRPEAGGESSSGNNTGNDLMARLTEHTGRSGDERKTLRFGVGQLFASGPRAGRDRIFHIAGLRLSVSEPPVLRDWIVNPGRPITKRLYDKSRVSTAAAMESLAWETVGPAEITPFFADLDVLFVFNVEQQLAWFQDVVLAGVTEPPVCIDLYALAQYFLPERSFYDAEELILRAVPVDEWKRSDPRLPYLVRGYGAVLRDVLASILFNGRSGPKHHLLFALLEEAVWSTHTPFDFKLIALAAAEAHRIQWSDDLFATDFDPPDPFPLRSLKTDDLITRALECLPPVLESGRRKARIPEPGGDGLDTGLSENGNAGGDTRIRSSGIAPEDVELAFDKLSRDIPSFQPREGQLAFARFCIDAINHTGIFAVEAGTGTGKTLGYLVPACEYVRRNPGSQFVVVTATKNLQNQIVEQELPKLTSGKSIYRDIRGAVLKGKANYLCVTAVADLFEQAFQGRSADPQLRLAWLYLYIVLLRGHGELEIIPWSIKRRFPILLELLEEVNAATSCMPGLCRVGSACVYSRHLRAAAEADIVVTNQHKLGYAGELLRERAKVCLIDEADQFAEAFRSAIEIEIEDVMVRRRLLIRLAGTKKRPGFAEYLRERFLKELERADREQAFASLDTGIRNLDRLLSACQAADNVLLDIGRIPDRMPPGPYRWLNMRPRNAGELLRNALTNLAVQFDTIALACTEILKSGRYEIPVSEAGRQSILASEKARLEQFRDLAHEMKGNAEAIAADYPSADFVHVFHHNAWGWGVVKVPFRIGKALEAGIFKPFETTIFTSATLFVDDSLDLFARELSLADDFDGTLRLLSPFDYRTRVLGAVTTSIRPYKWNDPPAAKSVWLDEIARAIATLAIATYGRTLVLFTNAREMQEVFTRVAPVLERHDIEMLIQEGSSLAEINTFRATEYSVLFGVERFWTGVDFPGPTLSQLIIVRIPNPNLSDPLIQHRLEVQGGAFWDAYYRPVTRLKLKQGFGRLIRSEKDRGLFVLLDRRILENARMRDLRKELPVPLQSFPRARKGRFALFDLVSRGLSLLELNPEFESRGVDLDQL